MLSTAISLFILNFTVLFLLSLCTVSCFLASDELDSVALSQLGNFVLRNMQHYFNLVGKRVEREQEGGAGDTLMLVRALDRFHRRLQAMNTLFSDTDFAR